MKKKLFVCVMMLILISGFTGSIWADDGFQFTDVQQNDWYAEYVGKLNEAGLISGYQDHTFRPNAEITVSEFFALVVYAVNKEAPLRARQDGEHWALPLFDYGKEIGLILAADRLMNQMDQPILREDMALLLKNAMTYGGESVDVLENIQYKMADYEKISADRKEAVDVVYSAGIMAGSSGQLKPKAFATRAEAATLLVKLLWKEERTEVDAIQIQFINKNGSAAQVKNDAVKMVSNAEASINEMNRTFMKWGEYGTSAEHFFIHAAPAYDDLDQRILKAQASGNAALEGELRKLQEECGKKLALQTMVGDTWNWDVKRKALQERLIAEQAKIPMFKQYVDTYGLQVLQQETEALLKKVRERDIQVETAYKLFCEPSMDRSFIEQQEQR